jgi:hypothetical protein
MNTLITTIVTIAETTVLEGVLLPITTTTTNNTNNNTC